MNCPKCNTPMEMTVMIGIKLPAKYVNQITKGVIRKKECSIMYAVWEKATAYCCKCKYMERGL